MKIHHNDNQRGQAILLIAMLMVALIASLGLAIDGGGMFLMYRDVQNATDAAALSAAYALCSGDEPAEVIEAGENAARENGFVNGVDNAVVLIQNPPTSGTYAGDDKYVSISITDEKPSYFIQIVYSFPLTVTAETISQCDPGSEFGWPDNSAIVSLSQTCGASSGGAQTAPMRSTGGSVTSTVGGGLYINTAGCSPGAADTNGSGAGINAGGYGICSDGTYSGNVNATEGGTLTNPCSEDQITDPDPFGLTAPTCTGTGGPSLSNGLNQPGNYTDFSIAPGEDVQLASGVYCITESTVSWKGDITSLGDGVVLYFNGSILSTLSGPEINLHALIDEDSDYTNLLMWFDTTDTPSNSVDVNLSASSTFQITGTIYAPRHHCNMAGQGAGAIYGQVICYSMDNNGGGDTTIYYLPALIYQIPPSFGITE